MGTRPWQEVRDERTKHEYKELLRWDAIVKDKTGQWFAELVVIESTMLGYEDHGILTSMVHIDFGGSSQGGGGYTFDRYDEELGERVPEGDWLVKWVHNMLRVTGASKWENLKGKTVYAIRKSDKLSAPIVGFASSLPHLGNKRIFIFADIFDGQE